VRPLSPDPRDPDVIQAKALASLERRWRPPARVIVAGLVVLMFHLVFFPWPDIFLRA
jgi:hypothetical protein